MTLLRYLRVLAFLSICMALAGCMAGLFQSDQKKFYYDIRAVTVLAGPKVPLVLVQGVERRLSAAVAATVRSEVLPRMILTVRVEAMASGLGLDKQHNEAEIKVSAASVETGDVVAQGAFKVLTITNDQTLGPESLAEEISARIRSLFSLTAPKL
ncbi:hypothetical protein [Agrobacterium vitis]|uniref:Lipoprotein n=1 Tax=Agrobacterium vitis TaxID=373 RepID=A0AAE2RC91_AGRVI|nr:hypothetical protein [Agrobacterium vitis]MBF2715793.1 hypothetical protein [Agrobacterium vitis]MUZ65849.1 hypothetical protein [Agrobacterium vitis]